MRKVVLLLLMSLPSLLAAGAQATFDPQLNIWTIGNDSLRATFQLTSAGLFNTRAISDLSTGDNWKSPSASPSTPIRLQIGNDIYDADRKSTRLNSSHTIISYAVFCL